MSEELCFFCFLLERYAGSKGRLTGDVVRELDERGLTQTVYDGYYVYHQEALENAFADIDSLLATGEHAW